MPKKIVTIGGGTGTYTVLSGLKTLKNIDITSIVNVTDSGGSTGRLRDAFGFLPVGDFRMALCALADANGESNTLRDLFLYRFDKGEQGLEGHNFGNLFLTALTDVYKSEEKALNFASKILRIKGKVLPISLENVSLVAEYENGEVIFGETHIDEPLGRHDGSLRIKNLKIQPKARLYIKAKNAILAADYIILGPGDLFTSTIANLVVDGTKQAIQKSKAKVILVLNLMTKFGQTHDFKATDFVSEIGKYIGRNPDFVLVNNAPLPKKELKIYSSTENAYPVVDNLNTKEYKIIRKDFLSTQTIIKNKSDKISRSLIRHEGKKLAKAFSNIFQMHIS